MGMVRLWGWRRSARPMAVVALLVASIVWALSWRGGLPRRVHASGPAAGKPNILILVGDDHAAYTLGADGDPRGATPRIDALAAQGVTFRRAYCNSPVCTPSRQSFITGRLPHAVGVTRLNTPLSDSAITLGDWLGDLGYATAAYGKMHFNSRQAHGFADRVDTPDWERSLKAGGGPEAVNDRRKPWRPMRDPASVWLNAGAAPFGLPDRAMESTYYADRAAEFFRRPRDGPFALVVGFAEPHSPFKFPDDWPRRYRPEDFAVPPGGAADPGETPKVFRDLTPEQSQGIRAAYYTSVSYLDSKVGRILDALEASGKARETIVVYLGDNGYLLGQHGRFEKHCLYEPAVRVPLIVRWPGRLPAGRAVDDLVELVDLMPTLLDLAGIDPPPGLHGRSLAALARGEPGSRGRAFVFSEYLENEEAMVSDGRHKLIVRTGRRHRRDGYETDDPTPGPSLRLYDLAADPVEDVDLSGRPDLAATKNRLLDELLSRLTTTRRPDDPPPAGLGRIETIRRCLVPRD